MTEKIKVKLSADWSRAIALEKQTPNNSAEWKNCKFYIDTDVEKYDYWVVYDDFYEDMSTICPRENTLFISPEPPTLIRYDSDFLNQFGAVISSHDSIDHKNSIRCQSGLPWLWWVKAPKAANPAKSYDELKALQHMEKPKLASVINSSKNTTKSYRRRAQFIAQLEKHFGDRIDFFGSPGRKLPYKWDGLAPYKYCFVFENSSHPDYWTEKLSDAFLAQCYPIYYGCPNIHRYFDNQMLTAIDITQPEQAIATIEKIISNNTYEKSISKIQEAKRRVLDEYNLFALISNFIEKKESQQKTSSLVYEKITLKQAYHYGLMFLGSVAYGYKEITDLPSYLKKSSATLRQADPEDTESLLMLYWRALCHVHSKNREELRTKTIQTEIRLIYELSASNPALDADELALIFLFRHVKAKRVIIKFLPFLLLKVRIIRWKMLKLASRELWMRTKEHFIALLLRFKIHPLFVGAL